MLDGLYKKYIVKRTDGKSVEGQDFFVLRLDGKDRHGVACRKAALLYAEIIKKELPGLAKDLQDRVYDHTGPILHYTK